MYIPLFNFFSDAIKEKNYPILNYNYDFKKNSSFNFYKPNLKQFPVLNTFNDIEKSPINLIKFNCANEFAVNLFANKKINFGKIHNIIADSLSLDLKSNCDENGIETFVRDEKRSKRGVGNISGPERSI